LIAIEVSEEYVASFFRIYHEDGGSSLLSKKFLLENLTVVQLVEILFPSFGRSRIFVVVWSKFHYFSPSSSRSCKSASSLWFFGSDFMFI
jgi:hypothetical protein